MNIDVLIEILYVGFCFEKGRVYTNLWKPKYKRLLRKQVKIWHTINNCIINNDYQSFFFLEDLKILGVKKKLPIYEMYLDKIINKNEFNNNYHLTYDQKLILFFIDELLRDIEDLLKFYFCRNKQEIYHILRALHNLPRALLQNKEFIPITSNEAIELAISNLGDEQKIKYKKYLQGNYLM